MGETIKMSVWVEVSIGNDQTNKPMVWITPLLHETGRGIKRYQIDFEVPSYSPEVDEVLQGEVIELLDGNGVRT